MLQCSTRVPQKPTQNHKNGSNEGKVANISSVRGDDRPSRGPLPSPVAGRRKGQQGLWRTTGWEGYCTTRKSEGKAGGPGAGEMGAAANTR